MEPKPTDPIVEWLFPRDYFKSLRHWRRDVLVCCLLAAAVTPADPISLLIVAVPLTAAWLLIRYAIACQLSKDDRESKIPHSD